RDLVTGAHSRACRAGNADSGNPVVTADGRFVAFESRATNLAPDHDLQPDVYECDTSNGSIARVSAPLSDDVNSVGRSGQPSISADGNMAVFTSNASNLVLGDGNGTADVFARNLTTGVTTMVSTHPDGSGLPGPSSQGAISADGRYVAFSSAASGVVSAETPSTHPRIYRRDLATG